MKGLDIESLAQIADDYREERAVTGEGAGGVLATAHWPEQITEDAINACQSKIIVLITLQAVCRAKVK